MEDESPETRTGETAVLKTDPDDGYIGEYFFNPDDSNGICPMLLEGKNLDAIRKRGGSVEKLLKYLGYRLDGFNSTESLARAGVRWQVIAICQRICPDFAALCAEVEEILRGQRKVKIEDKLTENALGETDEVEGKLYPSVKAANLYMTAHDANYRASQQAAAQAVTINIGGGLLDAGAFGAKPAPVVDVTEDS